jgi:hypothetical protein
LFAIGEKEKDVLLHLVMSVEKECLLPEINRSLMIQYLLGELPLAWQERLEERFFTDKESFEQLKLVEDQLVDDYVSELLPAEQHQRFESHYLNSERRRQKLKFAQTMRQTLHEFSNPTQAAVRFSVGALLLEVWRTPLLRYTLWALSLIAIFGGSCLLYEIQQLRHQRNRLAAERAALQQSVAQPSAEPQNSPSRQTVISPFPPATPPNQENSESIGAFDAFALTVMLSAATDRKKDARREIIPLSTSIKSLRLKLKVTQAQPYSSYRATLETASGVSLIMRENLNPVSTPQGAFITFRLAPQRLQADEYSLTLAGKNPGQKYENVAEYEFRLVRRN